MVANFRMIQFSIALLLAVASEAFVPPKQIVPESMTPATKPSVSQFQLETSQSHTPPLFISLWPGQNEEPNEPESKRSSSKIRLNLSDKGSDFSTYSLLPGITFTESLEKVVTPVTNVIDESTRGWALSFANLKPETETTPIGMSFLATNLAYGIAGSLLVIQGNAFLGALTELASIASFFYHFSQLKFGLEGYRIVRLALLVDYFFALLAILVGSYQLLFVQSIPQEVVVGGGLAVTSLGVCWLFEEGLTYIFFHSLWHLFSAYTGCTIGSLQ